MKRIKSFFVGLAVVSVLLFLSALATYWYYVHTPVSVTKNSIVIDISKGSSAKKIAHLLEKKGVIRSSKFFYWHILLNGTGPKLRAGAFLISPSYSPSKIAGVLQKESGAANLIRVTIPEGYNIWDIADVFQSKGLALSKEFSEYAHTKAKYEFQDEFKFLKIIPVDTIEGYLYPETYYFSPTSTIPALIRVMLVHFQKMALPAWESASVENGFPKSRFTFHQILTVASLIEKEARVQSEMPRISSVFYNRLKKRMPLASDPTIVYALGKSYKKKVYYKDLKIDSPYNTYRNSGFMPSPIASMGIKAIKASLAPEKTNYYFFVANKNGTHAFTETYKQHLRVQNKKR